MASKSRCVVDRSVSFKDTSHAWKAIIVVMSLYIFSKVQGTIHTVCTKSNTYTAGIPLNCSSNQMIHVISKLFGRRTYEDDCTVVRADSNTEVFDSSTNGLIVNCNGYKQCTEQAYCGTNCNGGGNAYDINYECVEASQDEERSCECTVSGQSLDVLMIQHRGRQGVLQITTTVADNNDTWESNFIQFNTKIASDARKVVVTYSNHTDGTFWLRIAGKITHISCSNSLTPPTTTGTTKATDTTHTIETIERIEDTKSTETIKVTETKETPEVTATMTEAIEITTKTENTTVITGFAVCGVIIFLLLIIIGLLLVYFKVIKPRRRKQNNTEDRVSNNDTDNDNINASNETRNTYSDLVRYANQYNDYGKLQIYANP